MKRALRPMPVLFACQGCLEFGNAARDIAAIVDRRGFAEAHWLGAPGADEAQLASKARSRFPIYALDGCAKACASRWLAEHGVEPQRHCVLLRSRESAEQLAGKIFA